jgi:hypothetical protein
MIKARDPFDEIASQCPYQGLVQKSAARIILGYAKKHMVIFHRARSAIYDLNRIDSPLYAFRHTTFFPTVCVLS